MEFKENVMLSFRKVRKEFNAIKDNVSGWIFSINKRQIVLEHKIRIMEEKLRRIEGVESKNYSGGQNGRVF